MLNIHAIGTSHKHSPVEVRERLAFGEEELPDALLASAPGKADGA